MSTENLTTLPAPAADVSKDAPPTLPPKQSNRFSRFIPTNASTTTLTSIKGPKTILDNSKRTLSRAGAGTADAGRAVIASVRSVGGTVGNYKSWSIGRNKGKALKDEASAEKAVVTEDGVGAAETKNEAVEENLNAKQGGVTEKDLL